MDQHTPEHLTARSAVIRWLSGVLAGETDPISEPVPAADLPASLQEAVEQVHNLAGEGNGSREAERIRLFVNAPGGVPAPPYGSWWLEETLQGQTTREVTEYYSQEGLRTDPSSGPADYLPVELEFLHFLLQHQRAARLTRKPHLEEHVREREKEFLERYVLPWIGRFCSTGRDATEDRFWRAVLDLLATCIEEETSCTGASVTG